MVITRLPRWHLIGTQSSFLDYIRWPGRTWVGKHRRQEREEKIVAPKFHPPPYFVILTHTAWYIAVPLQQLHSNWLRKLSYSSVMNQRVQLSIQIVQRIKCKQNAYRDPLSTRRFNYYYRPSSEFLSSSGTGSHKDVFLITTLPAHNSRLLAVVLLYC